MHLLDVATGARRSSLEEGLEVPGSRLYAVIKVHLGGSEGIRVSGRIIILS